MKLSMYAIWDSAAEYYSRPILLNNDEVALRSCHEWMMDADSHIRKSPQDYTLFNIGTYDDETAQIVPADKFEVVCRFHEIKIEEIYQPTQLEEVSNG